MQKNKVIKFFIQKDYWTFVKEVPYSIFPYFHIPLYVKDNIERNMEIIFWVSKVEAILLILANSSMNIIASVYFLFALAQSCTGGKQK